MRTPDRARERTEQVEDGALVALGQEGPCFHPAVRVGLGDVVDGNLTRNGHHVVARVGDRIYDAFTGPAGMTLADCMARLQARYGFDWSIVATPSKGGQVDPGNCVLLLDALSHMRHDFEAGRIEMHIGAVDANVLAGFVAGYRACLGDNGFRDPEYATFSEWLRAEKGEFPPEGWAEKYLRDFQGDHRAAIRKFLNFVAEFRASNAR